MNKKISLALAIAALAVAPIATMALTYANNQPSTVSSLSTILNTILVLVWWGFMTIAVIMFVIAGVQFLTAQGDAGKLEQSRQFVIWGLVGIAVGLLAYSVINLIAGSLGIIV